MSADKDARIAELERSVLDWTEEATALSMGWDECIREKKELERKLAEQQAVISNVLSYLNNLAAKSMRPDLYMRSQRDSLTQQGTEELNNLLAKAKEEGRKEDVLEGCTANRSFTYDASTGLHTPFVTIFFPAGHGGKENTWIARDAFYNLITSAPKPQGETK